MELDFKVCNEEVNINSIQIPFSPDCSGIVFFDDRNGKRENGLLINPERFAPKKDGIPSE